MTLRDTMQRMEVNTVVKAIDYDAFTEAVRTELRPCFDLTQCSNPYPALFADDRVEVEAKTCRAPGGAPYECDGTEPVSAETEAVARKIAERFGLTARWDECEKGWGYFSFKVAK